MSRLLFCLSLLFTYSLSVGGGVLPGDFFPVDTLSVLAGNDDIPDGADVDKPIIISAAPSHNYHINNRQTAALTTEYSHPGNHPDTHPIRAPPV